MRRNRVGSQASSEPAAAADSMILNPAHLVQDKLIGSGGCGDVYLGRYLPTGDQVAIKVLGGFEKAEHDMVLFRREIEIHQTLKHRFLVPFIGFTDQSPHMIVTKYMPNGSLYDFLHVRPNPPLTPIELAKIAYAVAVGMNFLHEKNVIHRDLKSPNILLDKDKLPKICDFGLARVLKPDQMTKLIGTPQWMAPEIVKNEPYNEKVDVYSYGVVLWEMLTGQIPFAGQSPFQVVYALTVDPMPLSFPEDAPDVLVQLIQSCCHRNPAKRPSFKTILKQFDVTFPGCTSSEFESFRQSITFITPCRVPGHKSVTPPFMTGGAIIGSLGGSMTPEITAKLGILKGSETPAIADALTFFEEFEDLPRLADTQLWSVFLPFFFRTKTFESRVAELLLRFARISSILVTIASVPDLHTYLHPKTLDVFLYVVSVVPNCLLEQSRTQLKLFAVRKGSSECLKSIILLCKLCALPDVRPEIAAFFNSIAADFADEVGGHLVLRQLFVDHVQSGGADAPALALLPLYFNSKIEENVIAAYHCTFVANLPCDFVSPDALTSHLRSGGALADCASDLIRRHRDRAVAGGLIDACMIAGSDKPLLLLCDLAAQDATAVIECAAKWLSATKSHAVRWLPLLLVISQSPENANALLRNKLLSPFISEALKYGATDSFAAVCCFLNRVEISKVFWQQLDKAAILHLLSQRLKIATEPFALRLAADAFGKLASVNYSSGFGAVVQFLLKKATEYREVAPECVRALGQLVKHKELKSVFRLFNAIQTLEPFKTEGELTETIELIGLALKL
jgi:serine/threonine protein kinase